jgi:hypothetical protein
MTLTLARVLADRGASRQAVQDRAELVVAGERRAAGLERGRRERHRGLGKRAATAAGTVGVGRRA